MGSSETPSISANGPVEAADQAVPGRWEGDLVLGKWPSAVGTLVERHSRYVLLFPLPDGFTAERMRLVLVGPAGHIELPAHRWHARGQGFDAGLT